MADKQPNILFLMAAQLAATSLPFYGHKIVKTAQAGQVGDQAATVDGHRIFRGLAAVGPLGESRQQVHGGHRLLDSSRGEAIRRMDDHRYAGGALEPAHLVPEVPLPQSNR
jgi:hypothetical protein